MKIVIAPDSFKESLSAEEAARAMADGVRAAQPDAETVCVPVADGGEGTVRALVAATDGRLERTTVDVGSADAQVELRATGQVVLFDRIPHNSRPSTGAGRPPPPSPPPPTDMPPWPISASVSGSV